MPADRRRLGRTLRTKKSTPLQPIRETCIEDIRFIPSYPSNTSTNNDSQKPAQLKHKSEKYQQAQILLDLLEKEVHKRCEALQAQAERQISDIKMELKIQLLYLPEKVRSMKWNTFIREYNGDIDNVIKKVKLQHHTLDENPSISAHVDGIRRNQARLPLASSTPVPRPMTIKFETPAITRLDRMPGTIGRTMPRTARKGERILTYSINGSPILPDPSTVMKTVLLSTMKQSERQKVIENSNDCEMSTAIDSDTILDFIDSDQLKTLSADTKKQKRVQLEALQATMEEYKNKVQAALSELR
ncbi:unnamed protein product [Albugo candida]|uniref:Borealin N-terminal domain-containing protein n=1 Tax=Albugo candida TaxID=65357 RepID=A0A024GP24_9STRA|nr:unnamed protein product [Albugo candida]|eukprot:CCI48534.1 unnamed protein product [Albugo candida]